MSRGVGASRLPAAMLFIAIVTACGDSTAPGGPVSGRWTSDSGFSFPIDVVLTHRDTMIEGAGTMAANPLRRIVVIGFYSSSPAATNPIVLTFSGVNTIPAIFFGSLAPDQGSMTGEYRWTGLPPDTVTFTRR